MPLYKDLPTLRGPKTWASTKIFRPNSIILRSWLNQKIGDIIYQWFLKGNIFSFCKIIKFLPNGCRLDLLISFQNNQRIFQAYIRELLLKFNLIYTYLSFILCPNIIEKFLSKYIKLFSAILFLKYWKILFGSYVTKNGTWCRVIWSQYEIHTKCN